MLDKSKFRNALDKFYSDTMLHNLFNEYFIEWIGDSHIGKNLNIFEVSLIDENTEKEVFLNLIEEVFYEKETFQKLYKTLPLKLKEIFEKVIWEGEYYISDDDKQDFFSEIDGQCIKEVGKKFQFFKLNDHNFNKQFLYLDYDIIRVIRKNMEELPENFKLSHDDKNIEKIKSLFKNNNESEFLSNINLYMEFLNSGEIRLSNSGKILKESKVNMLKHCNITEYYSDVKGLEQLKTETISLFLLALKEKYRDAKYFSADKIKDIILELFEDKVFDTNSNFLYTTYFLNYLKGTKNIWEGRENLTVLIKNLVEILRGIPEDSYISISKIINVFLYKDNNIELIDFKDIKDYIYINEANYERTKILNYETYIEYVTIPFIKSFVFLLGVLGIFELVYDRPGKKDSLYLKSGYLSKYEGLRYIKLTDLGKYVFEKIDNYENLKIYEKSEVQLDDKRHLVTVIGETPVRRMFFETIGKKISGNLYKVTKDTFIKGIENIGDLNLRIEKFKENIDVKDIPKVWQEFFEDLREKFTAIEVVENIVVLKLVGDKSLINLVVKDNKIKDLILKAEDYHILVKQENLKALIKIFNDYGYYF